MHGGVILFRGTGADARRYVEADRSRADDYYLGSDASVAAFTALDSAGNVTARPGIPRWARTGRTGVWISTAFPGVTRCPAARPS